MTPTHASEEILAVFDAEGNRIGAEPRSLVRVEPRTEWLAVADVFVVNAAGEILCSQRSASLEHDPNKWQSRFGGHMQAGDSFVETAIRELYEEAGIHATADDLALILKGSRPHRFRHFEYFAYAYKETDRVAFVDGETAAVAWMSPQTIAADVAAHPEKWRHQTGPEILEPLERWMKEKGIPLAKTA